MDDERSHSPAEVKDRSNSWSSDQELQKLTA
jgi:hypothetical protein